MKKSDFHLGLARKDLKRLQNKRALLEKQRGLIIPPFLLSELIVPRNDIFQGRRTAILTVRHSANWQSVRHSFEYLESQWAATSDAQHEVRVINADRDDEIKLHFDFLMTCQSIVVLLPQSRTLKVVEIIRRHRPTPVKLYFQLFSFATDLCIPLFAMGFDKILQAQDTFLVSCRRDLDLVKFTFPKSEVKVVPIYQNPDKFKLIHKKAKKRALVYVGRYSQGKNLHDLIVALEPLKKILKAQKVQVHFFGSEDFHGQPQLGLSSKPYKYELFRLAKRLGLEDYIQFHGHATKAELNDFFINHESLFVSLSTYKDENYGLAVRDALGFSNCKALLTAWGCHFDVQKLYSDKVRVVPVFMTERGPKVDLATVRNEISYWLKKKSKRIKYIPKRKLVFDFASVLISKKESSSLLVNRQVLKAAQKPMSALRFSLSGAYQSIFSSYEDRLFRKICSIYGARKHQPKFASRHLNIPPWIEVSGDSISVKNPSRPDEVLPRKGKPNRIILQGSKRLLLSRYEVGMLRKQGEIFSW